MENRFTSVMAERSNEELMDILLTKRSEYQHEAVDAARCELRRRNLSHEQIEEITDMIHQRQQLEEARKARTQSWLARQKEYFSIPQDLPGKIKIGAVLIYAGLVIDVFRLFLLNYKDIVHSSVDGAIFLLLVFYLFLGYMIHTGKNWARLVFVSILCSHLVFYPFYIQSSFQTATLFGVLISTSMVSRLIALALLFSKTTSAWYRDKRKAQQSPDSDIEMRKPVLAVIITLLFGAYMIQPLIASFGELKSYSPGITGLIVAGNLILLVLIFFLWYGYLRREFPAGFKH